MTRTIALAASKGGCGKSTLAACLAVEAVKRGERVALVDYDPQHSLGNWWDRSKLTEPELRLYDDPEDVDALIAAASGDGYTLVICDTRPSELRDVEPVIEAADLVLIPVRPSPLDVEAVDPVVEIAKRHGKPFAFILSATPRGGLTSGALEYLKHEGPVLKPSTTYRAAYASAMGATGQVGPDIDKAARAEISALWLAVNKMLPKPKVRL